MTWFVYGNLARIAVQGELEVLIILEQMLQNPSSQWEVNTCKVTPRKVRSRALALKIS